MFGIDDTIIDLDVGFRQVRLFRQDRRVVWAF